MILEVDNKALAAGQVQLTTFEGVLPDGVVLSLRAGHAELPGARDIAQHSPHAATHLEVYLGLPEEREGIDNFAQAAGAPVRYATHELSLHDLAGSGSTAQVPFARRRPLLVFGDEPRAGIVCFKLLEIVRDDTGSLVISEPYVPPCLRVDASLFLMAGLRRLLGAMLTRHKALSEARPQATHATVEFSAKDVTRYLLLSAINTYIPVLKHMIDSGHTSPCECYTSLLQLAGQLTTFCVELAPTALPRSASRALAASRCCARCTLSGGAGGRALGSGGALDDARQRSRARSTPPRAAARRGPASRGQAVAPLHPRAPAAGQGSQPARHRLCARRCEPARRARRGGRQLRDRMLSDIVRLQLERIRRRLAETQGVTLSYDAAVVELVVSRCTELESGARVIDALLHQYAPAQHQPSAVDAYVGRPAAQPGVHFRGARRVRVLAYMSPHSGSSGRQSRTVATGAIEPGGWMTLSR